MCIQDVCVCVRICAWHACMSVCGGGGGGDVHVHIQDVCTYEYICVCDACMSVHVLSWHIQDTRYFIKGGGVCKIMPNKQLFLCCLTHYWVFIS